MKRLLFLAPASPSPAGGGGALRMFHMLRFLGARFDLDLVAPCAEDGEGASRRLQAYCREREFVPAASGALRRRWLRLGPYEKDPALALAIHRRLASGSYGAVHVEKPAMLPYLPRPLCIPVILDTFAYGLAGAWRALRRERGIMIRARNLLRLARFAAFDAFAWPTTYCILVVSEVDRQRCIAERPGRKVLVVPNGVDCTAIHPAPLRTSGPPVLLFTGDMSFEPNIHAARLLATQIFPAIRCAHPDAQLSLAGRRPDDRVLALRGPGISVTGDVPDMLPYLHAATVYVAPLCTGAGTRTKLLEAMAARLPIVTSRTGAEGIEVTDGREVLIADDVQTAVAATLHLFASPEERRRLGEAARALAESRYDWLHCLAPLEGLYAGLLPARVA